VNRRCCSFTTGVGRHARGTPSLRSFRQISRCIAYDQRGWGQSDAPQQGYSISDLALDAKLIIEALHLRRLFW